MFSEPCKDTDSPVRKMDPYLFLLLGLSCRHLVQVPRLETLVLNKHLAIGSQKMAREQSLELSLCECAIDGESFSSPAVLGETEALCSDSFFVLFFF